MADVEQTLALLRDECEVCGEWGVFTGRTEHRDGLTYAVVRCAREGVELTVRSERGAEVLAAYERARALARPDLGLVVQVAEGLATLTRAAGVDPDAAAVGSAAGVPLEPPLPLGATAVRVDGGWLPVVELAWQQPQLRRADLDGLLGVGRWMPRVHPDSPHSLAYDAAVGQAGARVVVFAEFAGLLEDPAPESGLTRLMWRVDLPAR